MKENGLFSLSRALFVHYVGLAFNEDVTREKILVRDLTMVVALVICSQVRKSNDKPIAMARCSAWCQSKEI